jgi:hypothetical protein
MCAIRSYAYSRTDGDSETCLSVSFLRDDRATREPLLSIVVLQSAHYLHRTLLTIASTTPLFLATGNLRQHLTLAFLRAGGE